jgi:hypothetical protein
MSLIYMFAGFFIIYCGVYSRGLLPYLLAVGSVSLLIGIFLYFRYGPANPSVLSAECPRCGKTTRLKGEFDACDQCGQTLKRTTKGTYEPYVAKS